MSEDGSLHLEFVQRTEHGARALVVGGQATYRQAPDLRRSLIDTIAATGDGLLMIDLSGVDWMDTASMAVLVEGFILTQDRATEILLCGPSDSVRAVFRLAGLHEALGKCVSCREEAMRRIQNLGPDPGIGSDRREAAFPDETGSGPPFFLDDFVFTD